MRRKYYKSTSFLIILILSLVIFALPVGAVGTKPNLGTASDYGILGETTTVTGQTYVTGGSLGSGGVTGTATVSGSTDVANTAYTTAFTAFGAAISDAGSQPAEFGAASDLGGLTLTPGVYKSTGAVTIGSNMTLSGNGVYIFQIGGALTTQADTVTKLTYGAQPCNIFWVADVATIGANSTLVGTLMSKSAITLGSNSVTNGRVLAKTAVTANAANTRVNVPAPCAALPTPQIPTPTPTLTPTPIPTTPAPPTTGTSSSDSSSDSSSGSTSHTTNTPAATTPVATTPTITPTITPTPTPTVAVTPTPALIAIPTPINTAAATLTPAPEAPIPTSTPVPTPAATAIPVTTETVCTSRSVSVLLNSKGNMTIHAKLPNDVKGTGTWIFNLGGKIYEVKGSEDITYTAENVPVGTYRVGAQFIPDDNGETVDLALCTVSVPTVTGGQLPNTATPWYNLLLFGAVVSVMGSAVWIRRKIRE